VREGRLRWRTDLAEVMGSEAAMSREPDGALWPRGRLVSWSMSESSVLCFLRGLGRDELWAEEVEVETGSVGTKGCGW
jgi:hypothetical protein